MSRRDKLLKRFLSRPEDFTFDELSTLLAALGYRRVKPGKTGGSRVAFIHERTKHIIRFHRPHPCGNLRRYQLGEIEDALRRKGLLP